jgi:ribosomal protein L5
MLRCASGTGYKNVHQIPKVHKVVVNTSVGPLPT